MGREDRDVIGFECGDESVETGQCVVHPLDHRLLSINLWFGPSGVNVKGLTRSKIPVLCFCILYEDKMTPSVCVLSEVLLLSTVCFCWLHCYGRVLLRVSSLSDPDVCCPVPDRLEGPGGTIGTVDPTPLSHPSSPGARTSTTLPPTVRPYESDRSTEGVCDLHSDLRFLEPKGGTGSGTDRQTGRKESGVEVQPFSPYQ